MNDRSSSIRWYTGDILVLAADRSVRSARRRIIAAIPAADWIVVVRNHNAEIFYYAYRVDEVERLIFELPASRADDSLQEAFSLHEYTSSARARGRRPLGSAAPLSGGPAGGRIIDFDAEGRIVAIGEHQSRVTELPGAELLPPRIPDLGPMRGGGRGGQIPSFPDKPVLSSSNPDDTSPRDPEQISIMVSAETRSEMNIDSTQRVDFRIEVSSESLPLAIHRQAAARPDQPIIVLISVENDALEIVGACNVTVDPPAPRQPRSGNFVVKAVKAGVSRLAVAFHQGGSDLGVIGLAIEVLASGARVAFAQSSAFAAPTNPVDDDKLAIIIEQRVKNGEVLYRYILHSEALNLQYEAFESKPLLDRGNGPAATALAFVERIYARVTQELKSFDDLKQLQREARALGAGLSRELFDPDVARSLWPLRDRIKLIQIRSWEPYIPWELVRLHNPDTQETDDRFLAEYNLVRTLTDRAPVRQLRMQKWSYLAATFPSGSLPAVGAELDYFCRETPPSLLAHGIHADKITATRDAFYDALADGDFDVLHISCHAESPHQSIEDSNLIIGDTLMPGQDKPSLIEVNTNTVADEAKLMRRRPLVFLNACETARVGPVLTSWGGWPNVFMRSGAGAFVGAAWAVRDKPAAAFSTAFYEALWKGKTLSDAAGDARAAARNFGDASWLAFKVYGHPRARWVGP